MTLPSLSATNLGTRCKNGWAMNAEQMSLATTIVTEARAQGVEPEVALAFAIAESDLRNVVGDTALHTRPGYMDAVRKQHPGVDARPEEWASYGPFQLQARWYVRDGEKPGVLRDPSVSIPRAVSAIKSLMARYGGDVEEARLAYVCGTPGNCSADKREQILDRLAAAEMQAQDFLLQTESFEKETPRAPSNVLLAGALAASAIWLAFRGSKWPK
jgi:hypothetical protein